MIVLRVESFMPKVFLTPLEFFSLGDELSLFAWIKTINGITRSEGRDTSYILYFRSSRISDKSLRELLALFARYKFQDIGQLAQFQNKSNRSWLDDPRTYWHPTVYKPWPPRKRGAERRRESIDSESQI